MFVSNLHVVVEELLKFFIDKVDGDLLEAVVLEDLEAGNVQDGHKVGLLHGGVAQGGVTLDNQPIRSQYYNGAAN